MTPADSLPSAGITALPKWERMRVMRAEAEYDAYKKDARVAYGLWCVVGIIGGHRFYLGDPGRSMAMLFTFGGFGLWTLLDVFFIGRRVRAVNRARRAAIRECAGWDQACGPR